jgi:hypothetical protein
MGWEMPWYTITGPIPPPRHGSGRRRHMIAHVAGAPVEKTLLPLLDVGGLGAGLLLARAWFATHVRRPRTRSRS